MKLEQKDFQGFFDCTFSVYGEDDLYVAPLKSDLKRFLDANSNPLFDDPGDIEFFTVSKNDRLLGRIVAHIHRASNELHQLNRSYFGFFDCVDDQVVADTLLTAAEEWGGQKGCDEIVGSFNLTAMQQMGVMTDGFDKAPYLDQLYNPPHIAGLLERAGFTRYFPMTTFSVPLTPETPHRLLNSRGEQLAEDTRLQFKTVTRREFKKHMQDACGVLNRGFGQNPMFVPLTNEEFWFQAKEMMWVIDPHISLIAYDGNSPVGVVVCVPDINPLLKAIKSRLSISFPWHYVYHRFNRDRAVIIYYSVVPEWHGKGLNSLMLYKVLSSLVERNYKSVGVTWIADVNKASLRQMEKIGAQPLHRLHLFRKSL